MKPHYRIKNDTPTIREQVKNSSVNYTAFSEIDTNELFEFMVNYGVRFSVSEFKNPIVLELAKKHGLKVTGICERRTLHSRNTEILITNYDTHEIKQLF